MGTAVRAAWMFIMTSVGVAEKICHFQVKFLGEIVQ